MLCIGTIACTDKSLLPGVLSLHIRCCRKMKKIATPKRQKATAVAPAPIPAAVLGFMPEEDGTAEVTTGTTTHVAPGLAVAELGVEVPTGSAFVGEGLAVAELDIEVLVMKRDRSSC